jgi:hypothetical protein
MFREAKEVDSQISHAALRGLLRLAWIDLWGCQILHLLQLLQLTSDWNMMKA